jgi:hypothetical protein
MKIELDNINAIKTSFLRMETKEDLLQLLNEVKQIIYGEKAIPFQLKELTYYAFGKTLKSHYRSFNIKKKSGQERHINAPVNDLLDIQRTLSFTLQCVFEPHVAAMGFTRNKSIVDNAKIHAGSRYVYNIDLKDFFHSIEQSRVWACFQLAPFELNQRYKPISNNVFIPGVLGLNRQKREKKILIYTSNYDLRIPLGSYSLSMKNGGKLCYKVEGENTIIVYKELSDIAYIKDLSKQLNTANNLDMSEDIAIGFIIQNLIKEKHYTAITHNRLKLANLMASLCCTEMEVERKNQNGEWEKVKRNVLPQGAPTSPVITNIVCQRLDHLLTGVAKRFGLKYSRYADDITFSSMHNVYQAESHFLKELHRLIAEQGFHIKESKTRLQKDGYRKEVTGLLVNDKVNVQQRYIKQLRMWLYYWESYGYEKASGFFIQQYFFDKGHVKNGKPDMANVIAGKLDFLKMVKGGDNELYLKLKGRFNALSGIKATKQSRQEHLNKVIDLLFKNGLDVAMNIYKPKDE